MSKKVTKFFIVMLVFTLLSSTSFAATESIANEQAVAAAQTVIVTSSDYYAEWGGEETISLGSTGEMVENLQNMLNFCMDTNLVANGKFDAATRTAVIKLQNYTGTKTVNNTGYKFTAITADGIVGPYTWGKLLYLMTILSY